MKAVEDRLRAVGNEFWNKTTTVALTALGVVVALAWNAAIMAAFDKYFSIENTTLAKFVYALLVTIVLTLLTVWLNKNNPSAAPIEAQFSDNKKEVRIPFVITLQLPEAEPKVDPPEKDHGGI